jgi:hypothetical protein
MNPIIKAKLLESYKNRISDRLNEKGIKVKPAKLQRMVEAAMVRRKFLESASTPANTVGRGTFSFGNNPSNGSDASKGSGELFDELFGLFVDAYATTVGFDIIHTKQMNKSNITVNILEPVYAGGVINGTSTGGNLPQIFTVKLITNASPTALVVGTSYNILDANAGNILMTVIYVGLDRSLGYAIFKIVSVAAGSAGDTLETILTSGTTGAGIYNSAVNYFSFDETTVDYTAANVNHIQGYTGAGLNDTDVYRSGGHDGKAIHRGNSRQIGEAREYRTIGMRKWNRNFSAGSHKVKIAFTREMYQDMLMEEEIDLRDMSDIIGTEELAQSINQEVLSLVFAHGWTSHNQLRLINGFNNNLHLATTAGSAPAYVGADGTTITFPATPAGLVTGFSHNVSTAQRQIVSRIGFSAGVVGNRSRMGKGDVAVAGTAISSAISDIRGFREAPFENDLVDNQNVSFLGTFKRISLYEDTSMSVSDKRISVSKKGDEKTSGLTLCNYILADSVKTVAEQLGEEVSMLYSRMVVAEKGSNASLNYLTFEVSGSDIN